MGKPKQLLPYKHTTLLGWAIEQALASKTDEAFCVLGAEAIKIKNSINNYKIKTIINENYRAGLSTSIVTAVRDIQDYDAILIMLADHPEVTSDYLDELMKLYFQSPEKIIASSYEESVGVPAIFPKKYFPKLLELKGDNGAKKFLNKIASDIITLDASDKLADIDTNEDYKKLIG